MKVSSQYLLALACSAGPLACKPTGSSQSAVKGDFDEKRIVRVVSGSCGVVPAELTEGNHPGAVVPKKLFGRYEDAEAFYKASVQSYFAKFCTDTLSPGESCEPKVLGSFGPADERETQFFAVVNSFDGCARSKDCQMTAGEAEAYAMSSRIPERCRSIDAQPVVRDSPASRDSCGSIPVELTEGHHAGAVVPTIKFKTYEESEAFYNAKVQEYASRFCTAPVNPGETCELKVAGSFGPLPPGPNGEELFSATINWLNGCVRRRSKT